MSETTSHQGTPTAPPPRGRSWRRRLVVVGGGMVGHKLVCLLVERGAPAEWDILMLAEEDRLPYDRVHLSSFFEGLSAQELTLPNSDVYEQLGVEIRLGTAVSAIDPVARTVTVETGEVLEYDALVLATGSTPFKPPVPGIDLPGVATYRTIEDLLHITDLTRHASSGVVIGGGLLGLEAARALKNLGLPTSVVELAPRLMPLQLDSGGSDALVGWIEQLGIDVRLGCATTEILAGPDGSVAAVRLRDGAGETTEVRTGMVVVSAGIRPVDALARAAGLAVADRGGVLVNPSCRTSAPDVYAIGECANVLGQVYGLVTPGYQMAQVVADQLLGRPAELSPPSTATQLKLLGVEVASFGDPHADEKPHPRSVKVVKHHDQMAGIYRKLILDDDSHLVGGVLVGDASNFGVLSQTAQAGTALKANPARLVIPADLAGGEGGLSAADLPDSAVICTCENVTKETICTAISSADLEGIAGIKKCTRAGTGCGGCAPMLMELLASELEKSGRILSKAICEHFPYSRAELYDIVRVEDIRTFTELLERHGQGGGCEICKPAVASILASRANEYVLDRAHAALQDTNDHFLANIQRDGTYSIVPRVPGGEITPDKLLAIGQVAKDYGLYTKITGAQRIDLFGARVDQLPPIWERLVAAGFESGHAYGKALRTVKSCVGSTWCRYGVQDSVGLAIELELRYRGLRSPHKIKSGVSGCSRECAEAQGKDFGLIATERGWNLYVCGNGGLRPQHARLLAQDISREQVVTYLDRFLMFYIRTADRLERTATWLNRLEGGIEYLRKVVIEDHLHIAAELEAEMAEVIANYRCEWKVTLETPEMRERFRSFVNTDQPDPSVVFVRERDQIRPAPVHVRLRSAVAAGSANRSRVGPAPSGNLSTQGGHS